jgi:hypothetical protein
MTCCPLALVEVFYGWIDLLAVAATTRRTTAWHLKKVVFKSLTR